MCHWKAGIRGFPLTVIVLYYTIRWNSYIAKKSYVEIFHLYFLKGDIPFLNPNKLSKLFVANLETLLEGALSQIFLSKAQFKIMTKHRKLFAFL